MCKKCHGFDVDVVKYMTAMSLKISLKQNDVSPNSNGFLAMTWNQKLAANLPCLVGNVCQGAPIIATLPKVCFQCPVKQLNIRLPHG